MGVFDVQVITYDVLSDTQWCQQATWATEVVDCDCVFAGATLHWNYSAVQN